MISASWRLGRWGNVRGAWASRDGEARRGHGPVGMGQAGLNVQVVFIHYVTNAITNAITTGGVNANMHHVVEVP